MFYGPIAIYGVFLAVIIACIVRVYAHFRHVKRLETDEVRAEVAREIVAYQVKEAAHRDQEVASLTIKQAKELKNAVDKYKATKVRDHFE